MEGLSQGFEVALSQQLHDLLLVRLGALLTTPRALSVQLITFGLVAMKRVPHHLPSLVLSLKRCEFQEDDVSQVLIELVRELLVW